MRRRQIACPEPGRSPCRQGLRARQNAVRVSAIVHAAILYPATIRATTHATRNVTRSGGDHAPASSVCSSRRADGRRSGHRHGIGRDDMADPAGSLHPHARRRQRLRHRRAAVGGPSQPALGPAGRGRKPSRRRCPRRHQCFRDCARRSCAAVRAVILVHGAPVPARQPALSAERPGADHAGVQHHHHHLGAGELERQFAARARRHGARRAGQAELGRRHRRARFRLCRLAQAGRPQHQQSAVPQSGRCRQRSRRRPRAGLRSGIGDRAAAA